jgi:Zn-dependent protease with chaperone function
MSGLAGARVLPTDLEPLIGVDYEPVDADERGIWQSIERIEEAIQTSPQLLRAPALHSYTTGVIERLVGRPTPDLRVYLMRDASFNAAMFPTGMMIVHTGFMARVRNEAQFAAVLGHEAGHYFMKHSLEQYRNIRRKSTAMAVVGVATGVALVSGAGGQSWVDIANAISAAAVLSVFQFSRELEAEADAYGISLMSRSGYSTTAASTVWKQLIDERKASAVERKKRYRDRANSALSTHPPSEDRMHDLDDTATLLSRRGEKDGAVRRAEWLAAVAPHRAMLLDEQIKLNDPGASLYLINSLAQDGWDGLLRYNEGEIYRLRGDTGDAARAAAAYAAATALPDAPAEAWRAHGYAQLKAGNAVDGREALNRYLTMNPAARDAGAVRFALAQ